MDAFELKNQIIEKSSAKGWTNQQLADKSGVPLSTVAAIRSKNNTRVPSVDTAMRLLDALREEDADNEEWGDDMPHNPNNLTPIEISHSLIQLYEATIANERKWVRILAIALAVVVAFVFAILLYDITHPDVGWVQH